MRFFLLCWVMKNRILCIIKRTSDKKFPFKCISMQHQIWYDWIYRWKNLINFCENSRLNKISIREKNHLYHYVNVSKLYVVIHFIIISLIRQKMIFCFMKTKWHKRFNDKKLGWLRENPKWKRQKRGNETWTSQYLSKR